ncbi:hypothetical protein [Streptomyces resistomycificus]|uniref:Uncharacterized protein n=1 Tax=Streptomyces resistomycificus TaxID=67356 RepID=A0A0L8L517_9ACTN|nr:hypothetical protein [Streptomyces resistomycificus]KOG33318.1 hypothetical protein ADK37_23350 [Streptomyces resistomycificus]KUN99523.1 hypothetical protein AQJ84_11285 [Streptomyces resistomycificus]
MTPYERLMAEALPTGTFGHAQPARRRSEPVSRWTPEEQAAHLATLEAELDRLEGRGTGKPKLRVIEGEAA